MKASAPALAKYSLPAAFILSALLSVWVALSLPQLPLPAAPALTTAYPEARELASAHLSGQQFNDYFRRLADKKGAVYAYDVLRVVAIPQGTDAHSVGHIIGDILYKQKGIDGIEYCTQDFRNACSHSIVIGFLVEHGAAALPEAAAACAKAPGGKAGFDLCFHGIGHGLLAYTGYDLKKAVSMCTTLGTKPNDDSEAKQCVGGTIMEMIAPSHDPAAWNSQQGNYFKDSDPLAPCDAEWMPEEERPYCYVQLTPHLFAAAGGTMQDPSPSVFPKAFSFCAAIPDSEAESKAQCYAGFGKEFVPIGHDLRALGTLDSASLAHDRDWCAMAGTEQGTTECDDMALATLFWGGEQSSDAAFAFCPLLPQPYQDACWQELAGEISVYVGPNGQGAALCRRLPAGYQPFCENK